jgi:hypothetical protein
MTEQTPDPARTRFFLLQLVRVGGVALVFIGVSIVGKRWVEPADVIGGALILVGAIDALIVPRILGRAWRTPRP